MRKFMIIVNVLILSTTICRRAAPPPEEEGLPMPLSVGGRMRLRNIMVGNIKEVLAPSFYKSYLR